MMEENLSLIHICSFLDFACQAGADGLVYDKDGNVNITDQPYVDALDFMVEMANEDCTPSDSLATASTESQELFNNGKVAMQLNWSHQYPAAVSYTHLDEPGIICTGRTGKHRNQILSG